MAEVKLTISTRSFDYICDIIPRRTDNGTIEALTPQQRYEKANSSYVHRYGWGPFCRFSIPNTWTGNSGVYAICGGDEIKYIGETQDLANRFNQGYGNISPRNCFKRGQETNCRINTLIRDEVIAGSSISLFYHDTVNRSELESELIEYVDPPWNRDNGKRLKSPENEGRAEYKGKYMPLKRYLRNVDKNEVNLTFSEIEEILGFSLPNSAHKFDAWWSNGSKPHSYTWLDAGWSVADYSLSNQIVQFIRTQH